MSATQLSPAIPLFFCRLFAAVSLAGIIVQFFLAGMTVFGAGGGWDAHAATGGAVGIPILGLFLMSFLPVLRQNRSPASLLLGLYLLQLILAGLGHNLPLIGALHPVNGLLLGLVASKMTFKGIA